MKTKIFVTRDLGPDSNFYSMPDQFEVQGSSLIEITPVQFSDFPATDWIFFYSRHGVGHFFSQLSLKLPSATKLACIGPKTGLAIEQHGYIPSFVGDGHSTNTAQGFSIVAKGQSVLFPRARQSMQSIQKLLAAGITSHDLIVYDNQGKPTVQQSEADFIVFTSPLNAQTYLANHPISPGQTAVAMGDSTGARLSSLGVDKFLKPDEPNEEAIVSLILNQFEQ